MVAFRKDPTETSELLCVLFRGFMRMDQDRWMIANERRALPNDPGLFGIVTLLGDHAFNAGSPEWNGQVLGQFSETITTNTQEMFQVDLFSQTGEARARRMEILFALKSNAAQQMAEKYSLSFGQLPLSVVNTSGIEGTAMQNRYSITFCVLRAYSYTTPIDYYDNFSLPPVITIQQ